MPLEATGSSLIVGTPMYMAPEQLEGNLCQQDCEHQDWVASDIYSLGAILFEVLTGRPPVEGGHYFEVLKNIRDSTPGVASQYRRGIPQGLDKICSACLQKNPAARYASAAELAADLRRCLEGESVVGKRISSIRRYRFWHDKQNRLRTAGWYTIFYCCLIGVWFCAACIAYAYYGEFPMGSFRRMLPGALTLVVTSFLLPAFFGWLCVKKIYWAAWVGVLLNTPKVLTSFSGMVGRPILFREYYDSYAPYLCFTVNLFIFLCVASQLALYVFAIKQRKPRPAKTSSAKSLNA